MTASRKDGAPASILVVDDEAIVRDSLTAWFREDGYRVEAACDAREALRRVAADDYDIALVDIKMPGTDGLELQARLAEIRPELTVIIITAYASLETAVKALKAGAYDYITKPFDPDELSHLVRRATEHRSLISENLRLKATLESSGGQREIVGDSAAMRRVLDLVDAVAQTDATVLVKGESGTGKELVARAIHGRSERRFSPLVVVNCGALSEGILESELFGHEKGAFTGAQYRHKGKFEVADGGTLFLDEIGAIGSKVQVDLLRVLEDKAVTRVGAQKPIPVDFRIVTATNQDLERMVEEGSFRQDLFWRINVFTIEIPPLRERPQDIGPLARHFVDRFCREMNRQPMAISDEAHEVLTAYRWPGNVRELENAIERAVVVGTPPRITVADLPLRITDAPSRPGTMSLAEVERLHVLTVLDTAGWNISQAADILEIDRGTLYNKIKKYGLERPGHVSG